MKKVFHRLLRSLSSFGHKGRWLFYKIRCCRNILTGFSIFGGNLMYFVPLPQNVNSFLGGNVFDASIGSNDFNFSIFFTNLFNLHFQKELAFSPTLPKILVESEVFVLPRSLFYLIFSACQAKCFSPRLTSALKYALTTFPSTISDGTT